MEICQNDKDFAAGFHLLPVYSENHKTSHDLNLAKLSKELLK